MKVVATYNYVVLKAVKIDETLTEKRNEAGLIIPASMQQKREGTVINSADKTRKIRVDLFIDSVGPNVDLAKFGYSVGDKVYANDYDIQTVSDDEETEIYCLCKAESIKAKIVE